MAVDPISAIADAAKSLFDMVRTTIPTEAERARRWMLRYPVKYQRAKRRVIESMVKELRKNYHVPTLRQIDDVVQVEQGQLPYEEREDMKCLIQDRFGYNL